jgi:steroid delta-isomerase-like uncharacterized protein
MSENNKAIVRRFFDEVCNGRKLEVADEIFAPNFTYHEPPSISPGGSGPAGIKREVSIYHGGLPDARWVVHEVLAAENDTVVVRWTGQGTHQGELGGIPPTGKWVSVEALSLFRLRDGQIVEMWDNWDALAMMQQLGLAPTPGQ